MTNKPNSVSLEVLAHYLGRHQTTVCDHAKAGRFGALTRTTPHGRACRHVSVAEYENRYGPIDWERMALAEEKRREVLREETLKRHARLTEVTSR